MVQWLHAVLSFCYLPKLLRLRVTLKTLPQVVFYTFVGLKFLQIVLSSVILRIQADESLTASICISLFGREESLYPFLCHPSARSGSRALSYALTRFLSSAPKQLEQRFCSSCSGTASLQQGQGRVSVLVS